MKQSALMKEIDVSLLKECDLINKHFFRNGPLELKLTEIKTYIEDQTGQKISVTKLAKALKALNFPSEIRRCGALNRQVYLCGQK
jgi:hypothetical protein